MNNISTVTEVLGVARKKDGSELRGVGKKGEWVMYSVILANGIKMNVFGPVEVGDTVYNLEEDPQYHNWKGLVKKAGTVPKQDMSQPTNAQIFHKLEEIEKLLKGGGEKEEKLPQAEVVLDDISDEPVDVSKVPF